MWATQGLAVALALSVLPGGRALRPGDCEGAAGPGSAHRGRPGGGSEPTQTTERPRGRGWNGRGRRPSQRGPPEEGRTPA